MKSFLTATAILLVLGTAPALAQSNSSSGANPDSASTNSTSSGGQYTDGGIAGTSNGGGTAGTAATSNNSQSPDYDSTAADRRNSANKGGETGSPPRTMSQGPNGTPRLHDGPSDAPQGSYQPKTPP